MAEDAWLRTEREYFVDRNAIELDVPKKTLNKVIEKYNRFLQSALIDESPFVAEDLKLTILKSREINGSKQESGEPRDTDSKG
jgi:hypothetical protein